MQPAMEIETQNPQRNKLGPHNLCRILKNVLEESKAPSRNKIYNFALKGGTLRLDIKKYQAQ